MPAGPGGLAEDKMVTEITIETVSVGFKMLWQIMKLVGLIPGVRAKVLAWQLSRLNPLQHIGVVRLQSKLTADGWLFCKWRVENHTHVAMEVREVLVWIAGGGMGRGVQMRLPVHADLPAGTGSEPIETFVPVPDAWVESAKRDSRAVRAHVAMMLLGSPFLRVVAVTGEQSLRNTDGTFTIEYEGKP